MEGVMSSEEGSQQLNAVAGASDVPDKADDAPALTSSLSSNVNDSSEYPLSIEKEHSTVPFEETHREVEEGGENVADRDSSPKTDATRSENSKGLDCGDVLCSESGTGELIDPVSGQHDDPEKSEVVSKKDALSSTEVVHDVGLANTTELEESGKNLGTPEVPTISQYTDCSGVETEASSEAAAHLHNSELPDNNPEYDGKEALEVSTSVGDKNDSQDDRPDNEKLDVQPEKEMPEFSEPECEVKAHGTEKDNQDSSEVVCNTITEPENKTYSDTVCNDKPDESAEETQELDRTENSEENQQCDRMENAEENQELGTTVNEETEAVDTVCQEKTDSAGAQQLSEEGNQQAELQETDLPSDSLPADKEKLNVSKGASGDLEEATPVDANVHSPSKDTHLEVQDKDEDQPQGKPESLQIVSSEDNSVASTQRKEASPPDNSVSIEVHNTEKASSFTQVDLEKEVSQDKDNTRVLQSDDPIGARGDADRATDQVDDHEQEQEQGADEEICIIPDTERIISQAEKDAASALPTLRDLSEASASVQTEVNSSTQNTSKDSSEKYVVSKFDKDCTFTCEQCLLDRKVMFRATKGDVTKYICNDSCLQSFKLKYPEGVVHANECEIRVKNLSPCTETASVAFVRKCAACGNKTDKPDANLAWEIMDFCNEFCLSKYQREIGAKCSSCGTDVRASSLGKYCVRFGNDIRQFCTSHCLEEYKKGLKVCSYCQQDISKGCEGFLAPVGDKGHFKDFCSQLCMEKYDIMTNDRVPKVNPGTKCCVCEKTDITIEFQWNGENNYFCSEPCFVAFSFVNQITAGKCAMCRRNFPRQTLEKHTMYYDNIQHSFCSNSCQNIYIIAHRKIVPCNWCKVKKYNFDMIRRYSTNNDVLNMCSVNCYSLYLVSVNAVQAKKIQCDFCLKTVQSMYHLTMSDATIRNFCSYSCVMSFQRQFPKTPIKMVNTNRVPIPIPADIPRKSKRLSQTGRQEEDTGMPVISNVQSLATNGTVNPNVNTRATRSKGSVTSNGQPNIDNIVDKSNMNFQIKQQIVIKPYPIPEQRNVGTLVRTRCFTKGTQCTKQTSNKEIQTEKRAKDKILIPVPVPIYVPSPMHMYSTPVPVPIPIPIPIPVPIFIPTTRNSANGIMKEIKKIQVKIPSDPYEAELLMMAEMVADDKKEEHTDSESDIDDNAGGDDGHFSPEPVDASNTFGDDMLQMALKMATELDEPAVDLEGALTANTITAPQGEGTNEEHVDESQPLHLMDRQSQAMRGRKRGMRQGRHHTASKRGRRVSSQGEMPIMTPVQPPPPPEPVEKPDANMCLKYTFGVNAWKQWVTTKNCELEKSSRRVKLFKTEILQLTADELNYSLCLFVKEVRKPNGAEYAPDTIYYLCLGIQQYLFENGRIDNIFCDPYYEKFTDCLDEVARKFSVLYTDSHYIVTRVEEEHLWESKQLGAHSPHVLLSTLMFFNTKHFNLTTVDEHMQLSFSHIMKHWKRNPNQPGASKVPGSRNVLLRFYPPQSAIQNNARKKKVYEQQENEENPLRCPVKLYEFYLSKCPESVKTRNDVFYLQPERSCVPDSPVWYSTMPLPREALEKMLHRVKMVKEINVALLTS